MPPTKSPPPPTRVPAAGDGRLSPEPHLARPGPGLQPFGTLRLLPIALSAEARGESCLGYRSRPRQSSRRSALMVQPAEHGDGDHGFL